MSARFLSRAVLPTISYFYGIYIRMYVNEHPPPHFHAIYGEEVAYIDITSGDVIGGSLPRNARRLVRQWVELHREELEDNWRRIEQSLPPRKIEALDAHKG